MAKITEYRLVYIPDGAAVERSDWEPCTVGLSILVTGAVDRIEFREVDESLRHDLYRQINETAEHHDFGTDYELDNATLVSIVDLFSPLI